MDSQAQKFDWGYCKNFERRNNCNQNTELKIPQEEHAMDYSLGQNLRDLANLLNCSPDKGNNDDEPDYAQNKSINTTKPSDIGLLAPPRKTISNQYQLNKDEKPPSPDIWKMDEVKDIEEDEMESKIKPKYEMFFKQQVTAEDIFLQMGNKMPGSASCESLVYKISLPGTKSSSDIRLKICEDILDCSSDIYKLKVFTLHPVNPTKTEAKWDQDKEILTVTVSLVREFDSLNS